jgi:kinesin family protein 11
MSTLDYAYKAKSIRNKPEVNQKLVKQTLIKEYTEEIEKLKQMLNSARDKNGIYLPEEIYNETQIKLELQKDEIRDLNVRIGSMTEELEKLNELFTDTKRELSEKTNTLNVTSHKLVITEVKLKATSKELAETNYLLGEHVNTEKKLYSQASHLLNENVKMQQCCSDLHIKIDRSEDVMARNRSLVEQFVKFLAIRFEKSLNAQVEISE